MAEETPRVLTHWEMSVKEKGARRPVLEPIVPSMLGTPTDKESAIKIAEMSVKIYNDTKDVLAPSRSLEAVFEVKTSREEVYTAPYGEDENASK